MSNLSGIILAGGLSTRMGQDKALLRLQGRPLVRSIYDAAACCCDRLVVVSPWPDRYRPHLPPDCQYVIECQGPPQVSSGQGLGQDSGQTPAQRLTRSTPGPLVGFYQGLSAVTADWVLLVACDLPLLRPEPLQAWAQHLTTLPEDIVAYLPRRNSRWEPLCGFYRCGCRDGLSAFITAGGRSFQGWLRQQEVAEVPQVEQWDEIFYNCNTPQDWRQLGSDSRGLNLEGPID